MGLVRSAVRHYCLGGCSALVVCARRSRQVWGGGPVPVLLPFPLVSPSSLALPAVLVAGCPVRVSLAFACWYIIPSGLCVLRVRTGCPLGPRRVPVVCMCARAPAVYAPAPPPWSV